MTAEHYKRPQPAPSPYWYPDRFTPEIPQPTPWGRPIWYWSPVRKLGTFAS